MVFLYNLRRSLLAGLLKPARNKAAKVGRAGSLLGKLLEEESKG